MQLMVLVCFLLRDDFILTLNVMVFCLKHFTTKKDYQVLKDTVEGRCEWTFTSMLFNMENFSFSHNAQ